MRRFSYLIALSSVLAISACASNQSKSESSAGNSGSASSHEQHAGKDSGACRSVGEGHKVNGKGKMTFICVRQVLH